MKYKKLVSPSFDWLFLSFDKLQSKAIEFGFKAELVMVGQSDDYLARLTLLS